MATEARIKGAVGTEKRPPLVVVIGLGKGTEGPRETLGALWPLCSLVATKASIVLVYSNIIVMSLGAETVGALYCDGGCSTKWLRYQFYCERVLAILMGIMAICLEVGLPAVVNLSGAQRHHWYNNYAVRGVYFFLMGVLTLPDSNWSWYSNVIQDSALWSMYYAGFLLLILPTNFVLSFIPRGFPTSVKTQRPESTFWAAVTLITSALCAAAFGANAYELFGVNNGMNLATATYQEEVDVGHETTYGRKLYEYQSAAMRIGIAFLLPLLFAAEIEVTPVLRALPELRFLVTKGPMYLLIGTVLLISADSWPAYEFINDTAYICLVVGMMNLCFPAVRIVHELFGDRLSPKTRFYPGLYTFFSVWGVVLGMITIVLFLWEFAVYDNKENKGWTEVFQWYVFHLYGIFLSLLVICVEFEFAWLYEASIGGVPIHFDFLRNWIARAFLYLVLACICAASAYDVYGGLFALDKSLMWVWTALAITYAVFYVHMLSSATFYRWYIAHGAWFSKTAADGGYDDDEEGNDGRINETSALLGTFLDEATPSGLREPSLRNRNTNSGATSTSASTKAAKKKEPMKRFVLQPRGKLVVYPIKFVEGIGADGGGALPEGAGVKRNTNSDVLEPLPIKFFVKCLLGDESDGNSGQSRRLAPPKASKRPAPVAAAAAAGGESGKEGRVVQWAESEAIPLEVSAAVARAGKDAALEVQVWCEINGTKGPYHPTKGGELQVGEARVALDQLTLGVPGALQLHAAHAPTQGKGSLELVISYEPAPEDNDDRSKRKARERAAAAAKAAAAAGHGSSGGGGGEGGIYESAIDPSSGRKYYYNRATGHRTWNKPPAMSQGSRSVGNDTTTNATI